MLLENGTHRGAARHARGRTPAPDHANVLNRCGRVWGQEEYKDAVAECDLAIELNPSYTKV